MTHNIGKSLLSKTNYLCAPCPICQTSRIIYGHIGKDSSTEQICVTNEKLISSRLSNGLGRKFRRWTWVMTVRKNTTYFLWFFFEGIVDNKTHTHKFKTRETLWWFSHHAKSDYWWNLANHFFLLLTYSISIECFATDKIN